MTTGLRKNTVWALERDLKPRISDYETELLSTTACFTSLQIYYALLNRRYSLVK